MPATLTQPAWTEEYETEILDRLAARYAPDLLNLEKIETRPPETPEEKENFAKFRIAGAAPDLFIVQVIAKAIAHLVDDPHWRLALSRQLGDDGAQALNSRLRVQELLGYDPIEQINRQVPDEAVHRYAVIDWWKERYDAASADEKAELAAKLLEADNEFQRRRSANLKNNYWHQGYLAEGIDDIQEIGDIYDAWRQEDLSYLLNIPIDQLPALVSVHDDA